MKFTKVISVIKNILTVAVFLSIIGIFLGTNFSEHNAVELHEVVRAIIPSCICAVVSFGGVFICDEILSKSR